MNILDLDHSLTQQAPIALRLADGRAIRMDLLALGPKLRLWSTERNYQRFAKLLQERPRRAAHRPEIFFVGSGDYHHLTPALLADLREPVTLVHFDNHPDWVRFAPRGIAVHGSTGRSDCTISSVSSPLAPAAMI